MIPYLGSHVPLGAPLFYEGTVRTALSWGEDAFMFYTGAPQNTRRRPLEELRIPEGRSLLKEAGLDERKVLVHAPYLINLGNLGNVETRKFSLEALKGEMRRTKGFGLSLLVLHPGASLSFPREEAMKAVSEALGEALSEVNGVEILLETMAGKGTELGRTFEEIGTMIEGCSRKERLGVCLDTCHVHDAGYSLDDPDALLAEFDRVVGLSRLKGIHLNDSKNLRGARKDRHENIGMGEIGFTRLLRFASHPLLREVPKILETPYVGEKAPYREEIAMLRKGIFEEGWRESL